jgi:hypothetical protein
MSFLSLLFLLLLSFFVIGFSLRCPLENLIHFPESSF